MEEEEIAVLSSVTGWDHHPEFNRGKLQLRFLSFSCSCPMGYFQPGATLGWHLISIPLKCRSISQMPVRQHSSISFHIKLRSVGCPCQNLGLCPNHISTEVTESWDQYIRYSSQVYSSREHISQSSAAAGIKFLPGTPLWGSGWVKGIGRETGCVVVWWEHSVQ